MFASNPWWIQEMVVCIWPEFIYMHCAQRTEQNKIKKIAKITKLLQFHGLVHFIFYPIHSIIFLVFRELSVFLPSVSKMVAGKIWKSKSKWSRYWLLSPSASVSRYYLVIVTSYCCYFFFSSDDTSKNDGGETENVICLCQNGNYSTLHMNLIFHERMHNEKNAAKSQRSTSSFGQFYLLYISFGLEDK